MIFALIGAIVDEFIGAQAGLGMLIQSMNVTMEIVRPFSPADPVVVELLLNMTAPR